MLSHTLEVSGHIYQGHRCAYRYNLTPERAAAIAAGESPLRDAGDFADLVGWRVVETKITYELPRKGVEVRTTETRTLKSHNARAVPRCIE